MCTFPRSDRSKDIHIGLKVDCRNTSIVVENEKNRDLPVNSMGILVIKIRLVLKSDRY